MGFFQSLGNMADRFAMHAVNSAAMSRASYADGVDCVPADGMILPSKGKGKSEPPPRVSKMTWKETLEAEKAAKEKEQSLAK
ncbi:hypothetical protein LZ31DRAFT_560308 [Colletotrichum somersetense]|nr:hypothetical protein LZ31DRAFT_560308 [Colletotrichum somersetense]